MRNEQNPTNLSEPDIDSLMAELQKLQHEYEELVKQIREKERQLTDALTPPPSQS